jgi:hypothetical protein
MRCPFWSVKMLAMSLLFLWAGVAVAQTEPGAVGPKPPVYTDLMNRVAEVDRGVANPRRMYEDIETMRRILDSSLQRHRRQSSPATLQGYLDLNSQRAGAVAGDFDNDGKLDLIIAGGCAPAGTSTLYRNVGNGNTLVARQPVQ